MRENFPPEEGRPAGAGWLINEKATTNGVVEEMRKLNNLSKVLLWQQIKKKNFKGIEIMIFVNHPALRAPLLWRGIIQDCNIKTGE